MASLTQSSPLSSIANKIAGLNSSYGKSLIQVENEYRQFGNYLEAKQNELSRNKLPNKSKLQSLSNINVTNNLGTAGGLLGSFFNKSLDLSGLIRGNFTGNRTSNPQPTSKGGGRIKIEGPRALRVANETFANLNYSTGLLGNEGVNKSVAKTSGSLADSLLEGAVGQSLIPVPSVGFVLGGIAQFFIGNSFSGETQYLQKTPYQLRQEQEQKLQDDEAAATSKLKIKGGGIENQDKILNRMQSSVKQFEDFAKPFLLGAAGVGLAGLAGGIGGKSENEQQRNVDEDKEDDSSTSNYSGGGQIVQYLHGDPNRAGYDVNHSGNNAHDHFSFNSRDAAIIAFKALESAGYHPYQFEGFGAGATPPGPHKGHSLTGGHYGPVGVKGTIGKDDDGVAFDIPWSSAPYNRSGPIGEKDYAASRRAHQIVLQALRQADSSKPGSSAVQTGVKPGQIISTAFGKQGSTNIVNYGSATKTNIKGFIIVPGHITGLGAEGEMAAVQKIAKNIVDKLKAKYPGVPIQFWNNRNYGQTQSEFTRQMNDLKKLENQGWEIIEIHMDASIESGKGTGRGVIVPFGGKNLNEFDVRFAAQKGSYPSTHRGGLAASNRNLTIVETGNIGPQALSALSRGNQSAIDFFSSDTIQILEQLIKEGKIGGGYRPPQSTSQVAPTQRTQPTNISQNLSYQQRQSSAVILDRPSVVIANAGGNPQPGRSSAPVQAGGGGGTPIVISSSNIKTEHNILNKLQELNLV